MHKNVAVIVGVGPGLGHSVALRYVKGYCYPVFSLIISFAREGFAVALISRKVESSKATKDAIVAKGGIAHQIQADMAHEDQISKAFAEVRAHLGNPTVLVHNAARFHQGTHETLTTAQLKEELMVDAVSAFACVQQVVPFMKTQKHGTILFTGGGLSLNNVSPYTALGMGKAAQRALAQGLATELGPHGIHVSVVTVMGFIKPATPFDPEVIAEEYWKLHIARSNWVSELKFSGSGQDRPVMFSQ